MGDEMGRRQKENDVHMVKPVVCTCRDRYLFFSHPCLNFLLALIFKEPAVSVNQSFSPEARNVPFAAPSRDTVLKPLVKI